MYSLQTEGSGVYQNDKGVLLRMIMGSYDNPTACGGEVVSVFHIGSGLMASQRGSCYSQMLPF